MAARGQVRGRSGTSAARRPKIDFDQVYRENYKYIRSVCSRFLPEVADDAAQETFLLAYRRLHQFRGDAKIRTWLCRIAINVCKTFYRQAGPERRHRVLVEELPDKPTFGRLDEMAIAAKALKRVPNRRQREVVFLYHLEGMKLREIALATGSGITAVKARLHRGRSQFRRALERMGI